MIRLIQIIGAIALLCYTPNCVAQTQLVGQVLARDSNGIKDALVILPELNKYTLTDKNGQFNFDRLPKGYYKLQVIQTTYSNYSSLLYLNDSLNHVQIFLSPNVNALDEIVIYGDQESKRFETANTIEVLEVSKMRELGAMNLSDGLAKIPGVNQLTTGPGISKPVIRGLFGNRIQTVLLGIRFDNQQWQDEHGLGLSDIGVDRVEIIKGASSLFYGSEAMGGVVNIINEKPAPSGKTQADVATRVFSNTYGYGVDAGVKKSNTKLNWGIRLGTESHADYSDGNGLRILNSRFGGSQAKGTLGFHSTRFVSENNYLFSQSNFGFIMDAYQLYSTPDDRQSRSFQMPHHTVTINLFSSQNTFLLPSSKLKINVGAHVNNRQEQEGSGGISLDMLLKTYTALFLWVKNLNASTELSIGSQDQFQNNKNLGSRIIVPDADLGEASLFVYLKKQSNSLVAEGGARYDHKSIQTFATGNLNNGNPYNPGADIVPVSKNYNTFNGSLGISAFDHKHLNVKLNVSSGYRGPNLAELSSNGLHEGTTRYEIGDVNLKIEQNFCLDLYAEYYNDWFTLYANAYANYFTNYIYLQPDSADYLGFRIYRYVQKNATIQGAEAGIKIHPTQLKYIQITSSFAGISGQTNTHEYLPFIPAQKTTCEFQWKLPQLKGLKQPFFTLGYTYVFAQNTPNQFETKTPAYQLLFASMGTQLDLKQNRLILSVSGNNLLNEVYYDHLSRYKYYGIYNIGRSVSLNLKFQFN